MTQKAKNVLFKGEIAWWEMFPPVILYLLDLRALTEAIPKFFQFWIFRELIVLCRIFVYWQGMLLSLYKLVWKIIGCKPYNT